MSKSLGELVAKIRLELAAEGLPADLAKALSKVEAAIGTSSANVAKNIKTAYTSVQSTLASAKLEFGMEGLTKSEQTILKMTANIQLLKNSLLEKAGGTMTADIITQFSVLDDKLRMTKNTLLEIAEIRGRTGAYAIPPSPAIREFKERMERGRAGERPLEFLGGETYRQSAFERQPEKMAALRKQFEEEEQKANWKAQVARRRDQQERDQGRVVTTTSIQELRRLNRETELHNELMARASAVVHATTTETERYTATVKNLTFARDHGLLTEEKYQGRLKHQATIHAVNISAAHGYSRMGQMVQQLGFAAEDAAISFGVSGLSGAIRGASNNLSFLASLSSPWYGAIAGFAAAGVAIWANWMMKTKEQVKQLEFLADKMRQIDKEFQIMANRRTVQREFGGQFRGEVPWGKEDAGKVIEKRRQLEFEVEDRAADRQKTIEELAKQQRARQLHEEYMTDRNPPGLGRADIRSPEEIEIRKKAMQKAMAEKKKLEEEYWQLTGDLIKNFDEKGNARAIADLNEQLKKATVAFDVAAKGAAEFNAVMDRQKDGPFQRFAKDFADSMDSLTTPFQQRMLSIERAGDNLRRQVFENLPTGPERDKALALIPGEIAEQRRREMTTDAHRQEREEMRLARRFISPTEAARQEREQDFGEAMERLEREFKPGSEAHEHRKRSIIREHEKRQEEEEDEHQFKRLGELGSLGTGAGTLMGRRLGAQIAGKERERLIRERMLRRDLTEDEGFAFLAMSRQQTKLALRDINRLTERPGVAALDFESMAGYSAREQAKRSAEFNDQQIGEAKKTNELLMEIKNELKKDPAFKLILGEIQ